MKLLLFCALVDVMLLAATPRETDAKKEKKEAAVKKDKEFLQGRWVSQSEVVDGKKLDGMTEWTELIFEGGQLSWEHSVRMAGMGRTGVSKYTLQIDPIKKPKQLDLTWSSGSEQGKVQHGIYVLDDDTLKICVGKKRPKEFESKQGSGDRLITLKRKKVNES